MLFIKFIVHNYPNTAKLNLTIPVEFKVMEFQKRLGITIRLALLEHRLKKQGANAEKIALEKANYFANEELWSDVVNEIYQVKNPSRRLKQKIQQIESSDYYNSTGIFSSISSFK